MRRQQSLTQHDLRHYDETIIAYTKKFGCPPRRLSDLYEQEILDGWQRPFLYWSDGTNYLITSYGRDGKPGGVGLDSDLTNRDRQPPGSLPTFPQFVRDCPSGGILSTCVICGILTFLCGLFTIREPTGVMNMAFKIVTTLAIALLVASFMAILHIPTGH